MNLLLMVSVISRHFNWLGDCTTFFSIDEFSVAPGLLSMMFRASNSLVAVHFTCLFGLLLQATSKKVITRLEWEKKLNNVKLRKDDMNKLVMNFLVTEGYVEAAEKFRLESGTERILFDIFSSLFSLSPCFTITYMSVVEHIWISLLVNSRHRSCNYHRSYGG